jgi:hypothetical protein
VALSYQIDLSLVVIDFCLFLLASPTAGVVVLPIGCVTLLSQPIQISNELSQKSARMGAVVRAMGQSLNRADAACSMTWPQERRG